MIRTKITNNASLELIKNVGDVSILSEFIEKKKKYNLTLVLENLFVSDLSVINYSLNVKKIENAL